MSATQHAPPPISLHRDDKPSISSSSTSSPPLSHSPTYSRSSDAKPPIEQHPKKDSPPETTNSLPASKPESSLPSSPRSKDPEPESTPEDDDEPLSDDNIIDMDTFMQLIDLDEDDPDFSKDMAWQYFEQAESTFKDLDSAFSARDLPKLSSLGHYLKGSSAALGVARVQLSCEKIQHYGQLRDEDADEDLDEEEALVLIKKTLVRVKKEYAVAEKWLKDYYKDGGED